MHSPRRSTRAPGLSVWNTAAGALYGLKIAALNQLVEVTGSPGTLTLYQDDGATFYAQMTLRDSAGAGVSSVLGEPAQRGAAQ